MHSALCTSRVSARNWNLKTDDKVIKLKEKILYALWACLYILCVGLGTVEDAEGFGKVLLDERLPQPVYE